MQRFSNPIFIVSRCVLLLCLLALSLARPAGAAPGDWKQLGKAGDWKGTVAGVVLGDRLYSIETSGLLYATELPAGTWAQVGKGGLVGTKSLFTDGTDLYCLRTNGDLSRLDPQTGIATAIGDGGGWKDTLAGAVSGNTLYTAEGTGNLIGTDLTSGERKTIGNPDFGKTVHLFVTPDALFTIEGDGSLYKINPTDGTWQQIGKPGEWKDTLAGAVLAGQLYSVEAGGNLYITNLDTGTWRKIGKPDFGRTAHMFATGNGLYTIEQDGSLYAIESEPLAG